ncbi:MAG: hypothetical protein ACFFBT_11175 [Promethearchaeota archaeon]
MAQKSEYDIESRFELLTQQEKFLPKPNYHLSLGLDHPSVKKVIQIALKLTKEHRLINTELLYNRAKKELQIPKNGLKTIIQLLLNKKVLVDRSRLTRQTVLNNQIRYELYLIIKTIIGVHFSLLKELISIQKDRDVGVGQLNWHLEKLLKFNLIKKVKVKKFIIFLPIEIDKNNGILYFILRDEINRRIVNFIFEQGITNRSEIHKQLKLKREKLYYRIKKLIEFNILSRFEDESSITINPNKKNLLRDVLNNNLHRNLIPESNKLILMKA